jgi:hypothetical protein
VEVFFIASAVPQLLPYEVVIEAVKEATLAITFHAASNSLITPRYLLVLILRGMSISPITSYRWWATVRRGFFAQV